MPKHRKRRPTHPGAVLREDVLPALGMTQTELAQRLGVSRLSVSKLVHEKRALSPEMAARLGKLLRTTPESWLRMQTAVDLWELEQHPGRLAGIKPIAAREDRGCFPMKRAASQSHNEWLHEQLRNRDFAAAYLNAGGRGRRRSRAHRTGGVEVIGDKPAVSCFEDDLASD